MLRPGALVALVVLLGTTGQVEATRLVRLKLRDVAVRVTVAHPQWCGGAAPPPDLAPAQAVAGTGVRILARPGTRNSAALPSATGVAGPDGRVVLRLASGRSYCLVEDAKRKRPSGKAAADFDARCQLEEWARCDAVVHVPRRGAIAEVSLDLSRGCFPPCYTGPYPP